MNHDPRKPPPFQFGLRSLFGVMAAVGVVIVAAKIARGSMLWGPLLIVHEGPSDPVVWLITFALVAGFASFPLRPSIVTGILAILSALVWLFLGMVGAASG